jgi:hypothetical protein
MIGRRVTCRGFAHNGHDRERFHDLVVGHSEKLTRRTRCDSTLMLGSGGLLDGMRGAQGKHYYPQALNLETDHV